MRVRGRGCEIDQMCNLNKSVSSRDGIETFVHRDKNTNKYDASAAGRFFSENLSLLQLWIEQASTWNPPGKQQTVIIRT